MHTDGCGWRSFSTGSKRPGRAPAGGGSVAKPDRVHRRALVPARRPRPPKTGKQYGVPGIRRVRCSQLALDAVIGNLKETNPGKYNNHIDELKKAIDNQKDCFDTMVVQCKKEGKPPYPPPAHIPVPRKVRVPPESTPMWAKVVQGVIVVGGVAVVAYVAAPWLVAGAPTLAMAR